MPGPGAPFRVWVVIVAAVVVPEAHLLPQLLLPLRHGRRSMDLAWNLMMALAAWGCRRVDMVVGGILRCCWGCKSPVLVVEIMVGVVGIWKLLLLVPKQLLLVGVGAFTHDWRRSCCSHVWKQKSKPLHLILSLLPSFATYASNSWSKYLGKLAWKRTYSLYAFLKYCWLAS